MKVRVLKEMPFAKVGEVFEADNSKGITLKLRKETFWLNRYGIVEWIRDGWLEEVKEESLEDKYNALSYRIGDTSEELAQIAKDHYLNIVTQWEENEDVCSVKSLRKALEEG